MASKRPNAPAGLAPAGRALWKSLCALYVFGPREAAVLALACKQADTNATIEALLVSDGLVVVGSRGQPRLSAMVGELRQSRLALARLLGELALPGEDDKVPRTAASERGRHAARSRWANDGGVRRGKAPAG